MNNVENYLKEVSQYLVVENPKDILLEIRTHILETAEEYGELTEENIDKAITQMGSPRSLAANYGEGKEIIAPDLRNYLLLYTAALFAIHLGAIVVASILGSGMSVFPFLFVPALDGILEILLFLPFALVFAFGLVSIILFALSQWAPNVKLWMPEVSQEKIEPSPWTFAIQVLGFAGFMAFWHFHESLLELAKQTENVTVIFPARIVFLPPMIIMAVSALTTMLEIIVRSKLVQIIGGVVGLVAIWIINIQVGTPPILDVGDAHWVSESGFQWLLVLIAVSITIELVKQVVVLASVVKFKRETSFRAAKTKDWASTVIRLFIYMGLVSLGAIFVLPSYPIAWLAIITVGLLVLVRWHNNSFGFKCQRCDNEFQISTLVNFISPHGVGKDGGWKFLRCPRCKLFSKARVVKKDRSLKIS